MARLFRWLLAALLVLATLIAAVWSGAAVWFAVPASEGLRLVLVTTMAVLALGGLAAALFRTRLAALIPSLLASLATLLWWLSLEPSNDRVWQQDVAQLTTVTVDGDLVTIHNMRGFRYEPEGSVDEHWYDKTVDLSKLDHLNAAAVYWAGDAIAHIIVSFGFGDDYVAVSIETRKEQHEVYSTLAGFFRQYELYYVVGDELDLLGSRAVHRIPPEDVYLYSIDIPKERIKALFMDYVSKINGLAEEAEFYNTLTTNCTTNIILHARGAQGGSVPWSWKILISGYFPELLHDRGLLMQSMDYEELRQKSLVNARAREIGDADNFSTLIREGLPGF